MVLGTKYHYMEGVAGGQECKASRRGVSFKGLGLLFVCVDGLFICMEVQSDVSGEVTHCWPEFLA